MPYGNIAQHIHNREFIPRNRINAQAQVVKWYEKEVHRRFFSGMERQGVRRVLDSDITAFCVTDLFMVAADNEGTLTVFHDIGNLYGRVV